MYAGTIVGDYKPLCVSIFTEYKLVCPSSVLFIEELTESIHRIKEVMKGINTTARVWNMGTVINSSVFLDLFDTLVVREYSKLWYVFSHSFTFLFEFDGIYPTTDRW